MIQVSILMPVWNGEEFISRCLDSVLSQSFYDFEFIIVDDGSTDNTINIIKDYQKQDNRIKLFECEHKGIVDALNYGLDKCTGKYICRMDCDDMMMKDSILKRYNYMESNPEVDFITTGSTNPTAEPYMVNVDKPEYIRMTVESIKKGMNGVHPTVFFKRETFNTYYDKEFEYREDLELYLRLASRDNYICMYCPYMFTVYYMRHENAASNIHRNELIKILERLKEIYGK